MNLLSIKSLQLFTNIFSFYLVWYMTCCWLCCNIFHSTLQKGLKNVFDEAILAALEPPEQKKKKKCVILWTQILFILCLNISVLKFAELSLARLCSSSPYKNTVNIIVCFYFNVIYIVSRLKKWSNWQKNRFSPILPACGGLLKFRKRVVNWIIS